MIYERGDLGLLRNSKYISRTHWRPNSTSLSISQLTSVFGVTQEAIARGDLSRPDSPSSTTSAANRHLEEPLPSLLEAGKPLLEAGALFADHAALGSLVLSSDSEQPMPDAGEPIILSIRFAHMFNFTMTNSTSKLAAVLTETVHDSRLLLLGGRVLHREG